MTKKVVILGGGLTGLVIANKLAPTHDVVLAEQNQELGGMLSTRYVEDAQGRSFRFDVGGHWLHHQGFAEIGSMFTRLKPHERHAYVHLDGQYGRFPIQAFYADVFSPSECEQIYQELSTEPAEPASYADMLLYSYGELLFRNFFAPYNKKLFGTEDLDKIATGKLELVRNVRVGDKQGYNDLFLYPDGYGISSLVDDLYTEEATYLLGHEVVAIDLGLQRVYFANGQREDYDILISTVPLNHLLQYQDCPELAVQANALKHSVGRILNLGLVHRPEHDGKTWVYYADEDLPFYRVGFYSNVDATAAPDGYTAAYVEVSTLRSATYDEIVDGLIQVGLIDCAEDVVVSEDVHLGINYCFTYEQTKAIQEQLKVHGVYSIGRYGSWHWSSMHQDVQQALDLVQEVLR